MEYPLEERTYVFGKNILLLCQKIPNSSTNYPLVNQLVRSGTSVGANYSEANGASSRKDFKNKIHICKKESQETRYWLRMLSDLNPALSLDIDPLSQESKELSMIFGKIVSTMNGCK